MCGLTGVFFKGLKDQSVVDLLNNATMFISHRGPDNKKSYADESFFALFQRLSIIDLTENSDQPFEIIGTGLVLVFNGEIYNFKELRNELLKLGYDFLTNSDTEVLYYSYCEWGVSCFGKLRGIFAAVFYDRTSKSITLVRDQFGVKPLYYTENCNYVAFSSEEKALLPIAGFELDATNLIEHLSFGDVLGSETLYKNIQKLEPGQYIQISADRTVKEYYYYLPLDFSSSKIDILEIEECLNSSIIEQTYSDVPYALQLSGGLDSSYIARIASLYSKDQLDGFSIIFENDEVDESKYQKYVANLCSLKLHQVCYTENDFFDVNKLKKSIRNYDAPLHHPNILATDMLNSYASELGFKVMLSGDGADEVFSGYNWFLLDGKCESVRALLNNTSFVPPEIFFKMIKEDALCNDLDSKFLNYFGGVDKFDSIINQLAYKSYLQKWLKRQDRSGMLNSIEIRVPFLNVSLTALLNKLQTNFKTKGYEQPKYLLKLISEKYFSHEFIYRKKIGFPLPIEDWFRKVGNPYVDELKNGMIHTSGLFDLSKIRLLVDDHLSGLHNNGRVLWMLINLEYWLEINSNS